MKLITLVAKNKYTPAIAKWMSKNQIKGVYRPAKWPGTIFYLSHGQEKQFNTFMEGLKK